MATHQAVQLSDGRWVSNGEIVSGAGSSATQAPSWLGLNSDGSLSSSGSGSSARSVSNSSGSSGSAVTSSSSMATALSQVMDQIYQITERNTARSEQQAAELRDWQERQNQLAMNFNSAEAAKNRDWQQMMSDTAHQREVKDLQAAGLNPILSASGGNGAAVTSGATASGVTSSGAKGEVDTSADAALVNLMGAMWSAQTQLESQRLTAQNNMAIAEKNNATSQAIAALQTQSQQEVARISGQYGLSVAGINQATSKLVAQINAGSAKTSAEIYSAASRYAAELGYEGTQAKIAADLIVTEANNQNALEVANIHLKSSPLGYIDSSVRDATGQSIGSLLGDFFGLGSSFTGFTSSARGNFSGASGGGFSRK
ncbi:DNA pilot protein [Peromfec virus RodF8_28]|uniref:DNA pilot protein n=1 Tax=Peromfec virus RodF8_28 TaxID=2929366 RepID=A0A976N254_9VIRU|nr:DNA pilot protein [Peromfec virus RodF8_28]